VSITAHTNSETVERTVRKDDGVGDGRLNAMGTPAVL
jgi:hypothetical protein